MVEQVLVNDIVASLARRGFTSGLLHGPEDITTQVLAVDEELGEVARMLRRIRQGVDPVDRERIAEETVDVLITAVCLASMASGVDLGRVIKAKLAQDEARGYLHRGGPLRVLPLSVAAPLTGNVQTLAGIAEQARRDGESGLDNPGAGRYPEGVDTSPKELAL